MPLLIRITTVPASLKTLLKGQMKYMKQQGFEVIMISAGGAETEEVKKNEGCEHIAVPLTRTINPLNDLRCLIELVRLFRKYRPDIVHTHTPKAGLLGMLAAFICRVPVRMHTVAGLPWIDFKGFSRLMMIQLEKLNFFLADAVYPNSENLLRLMQQYNIGKTNMKVLAFGTSNGIDTNWYSQTADGIKKKSQQLLTQCNVPQNARVWIFVGRLVKDKGIGELLRAFIQLQKEFHDDQLWLVGEEEPDRDPLTNEQKHLIETNASIIKWGFQNDIRPFLAASGLLVFPSYREGFPNVPLQAASMECAMILSNINGCNEIVEDGVNGLLVPAKTHVELYKAMHKLRTESELQIYFASNASSLVKNKFEQRRVWDAVYKEYLLQLEQKQIEFPVQVAIINEL